MDLNDFSQIFFIEAAELLQEMEQHLLQLDLTVPDSEQLNAIFRAAHSLKGGAGTFGFSALQETTHLLENLLDDARSGELKLDRAMINLFLESKDIMQAQLEAYQASQEPDEASFSYICEALREIALQTKTDGEKAPPATQTVQPVVNMAENTELTLRVTLSDVDADEQKMLRDELVNMGDIVREQRADSSLTVDLTTTVTMDDIVAVLVLCSMPRRLRLRLWGPQLSKWLTLLRPQRLHPWQKQSLSHQRKRRPRSPAAFASP